MFNRYLELGERHIDDEWTRKWISERIPPSSRHNINEILQKVGISEYNPYHLLIYNGGRCSQDDFYLREVTNSEDDEVRSLKDGCSKDDQLLSTQPDSGQASRYEYATILVQEGLGSTLAKARRDAGITQQELSYRTGIRQSTISRLERGLGNPTVETLSCIAQALNLRLSITLEP